MIDKVNSQVHFGAINKKAAESYIFSHVNGPKHFVKLNSMIKAQEKNPNDIVLFTDDENLTLSAMVYDRNKKLKKIFHRGIMANLYMSTTKFIEKVCKYADSLNK